MRTVQLMISMVLAIILGFCLGDFFDLKEYIDSIYKLPRYVDPAFPQRGVYVRRLPPRVQIVEPGSLDPPDLADAPEPPEPIAEELPDPVQEPTRYNSDGLLLENDGKPMEVPAPPDPITYAKQNKERLKQPKQLNYFVPEEIIWHIPLKNRIVLDRPNSEGWWWFQVEGADKSQMVGIQTGLIQVGDMHLGDMHLRGRGTQLSVFTWTQDRSSFEHKQDWISVNRWHREQTEENGGSLLKCVKLLEINPFAKEME